MSDPAQHAGGPGRAGLTRRRFLRRSLAVGGLVATAPAALAALTGCAGSSEAASGPTGPPRRGGTLTLARADDVLGVDPTGVSDNESIWMVANLYERLYQSAGDGRFVPVLAQDHTLSGDGTTWRFRLREGVRFSDGRPLTAADVKFSLDRNTASPDTGFLNVAFRSVEAPDDRTVVVRTKYPTDLLGVLSYYGNGVLPRDLGGRTKKEFFAAPVGTGPFRMVRWDPGRQVELRRNVHHWRRGRPYLDRVVLTAVTGDSTRALQLRGRQADVIEAPAWSQMEELRTLPDVRVGTYPSTVVYFLVLNTRQPELADPHVRAALSLAIDRDAMVKVALFGNGRTAGSIFNPTWPGHDASLAAPRRDLAAARAALARSRYPRGFTVKYWIDGGDTVQSAVAQTIQNDVKSLGIDVAIEQYDPNTLWDLIDRRRFGIVHRRISLDVMDSRENVPYLIDPAVQGYAYYASYRSRRLEALSDEAEHTTAARTRDRAYGHVQRQLAADLPFVPLYYVPWSYAMSTRVRGFTVPPTGDYPLGDVWLAS